MPEEELFDVCDEWGRPLGRTKPRSLVHRDGDWHRSFHCWLVERNAAGEVAILLQRRALDKDTWPGMWDVSVAGHYAAGEGIEGGLREIQEEIGLEVTKDALLLAGRRREEVRHRSDLIEREVQDIYFLRRELDLFELRPDPAEVIAVARVPAAALLALAEAALPRLTVAGLSVGAGGSVEATAFDLTPVALVPRADGYYAKVVQFADRLGASETPAPTPGWW